MKLLLLGACIAAVTAEYTQIHIALAGDDGSGNSNGMAVSWQTEEDTPTTVVKFGLSPDDMSMVETGTSSTYYSTYDHHTVLEDLAPDTKYFYSVGDGETFSDTLQFTTSPEGGDSVTFAVWGDLGLVNGDSTREYLVQNKEDIDLIFHLGDVGYADDSFLHLGCMLRFCYEEKFNEYMESMQPIVSEIPYHVMPGNHEADCHDPACLFSAERRDKLSNFTAYNSRFRMPSEESGGVMNMWHSFNYGPVHFVALDLETGFPGAAEEKRYVLKCGGFGDQLTWLREDLEEAVKHREERPWIVLGGHHPMYNGGMVDPKMAAAIEPLLAEFGVDVFFTGHVHSYERDWPVLNSTTVVKSYSNPGIPTHVMIGGPGNDEMTGAQRRMEELLEQHPGLDPSRVSTQAWFDSLEEVNRDMIAVTDMTHFGIGIVKADMESFNMQYVQTTSGEVFDEFTLTK
ncbi:hypothetical protein TrRE_jg4112 [Triparma retinervis]|uniref:Purple acid phosphatase n=1 Tax=Triparma retinervis TaxID=2557542 RepID=A0A9W7G4H2_9STRA|nr:hypothetical protein TrRE_jg4112 [Triparma retinervis]